MRLQMFGLVWTGKLTQPWKNCGLSLGTDILSPTEKRMKLWQQGFGMYTWWWKAGCAGLPSATGSLDSKEDFEKSLRVSQNG